jgi:uncharacterized protein DUF6580
MSNRLMVIIGMVVAAALSRLVPHPPNVTPIAAMALFGGAYLRNRKVAYLMPLAAMLLSDVVLGYSTYGAILLKSQPVVYLCMLATVAMGRLIRDTQSPWQVGWLTLASSVMFYVVTNFAVWAAGSLYPLSWAGLAACYTAAIPFFRNSVLGDAGFAVVMFGGFALLEASFTSLRDGREHSVAAS